MARSRRGRGEGGIFQRADGYWVGTVSFGYAADGKRKRKTVYAATKKEVQDKLQELRNPADLPKELAKITVEGHMTKWLEMIKPTVEHQTYRKYEEHARLHIIPHIGTLKLMAAKRFHVEGLYVRLATLGVSAAMQKKVGTTLTMAFGDAVDKDMITVNPVQRVRKPKAAKVEMTPLTAVQVTTFLEAAAADRLYAFYVLALDSGMRPGELFAMGWPDVDFERACVTVTKSLAAVDGGGLQVKDTKTQRGRRRIQLSSFTLAAMHEHRKRMMVEGHVAGPVFCSTVGGWSHLTNVHRHSFKPILERAGLPDVRLYDLRHTCATLLLASGENVKVVSERLGHASIVLTLQTYAHVLPGMQEAAAGRMQGILDGKPTKKASG